MAVNNYEPWTQGQLDKVLLMVKEGKSYQKIAKKMKRSVQAVHAVLYRYNSGKLKFADLPTSLVDVEIDKEEELMKNPEYQKALYDEAVKRGLVSDPFVRLENAFKTFQEEVGAAIMVIVDSKVKEVKRQNTVISQENQELKAEIESLNKIKEVARRSNWIGNLRQHFTA